MPSVVLESGERIAEIEAIPEAGSEITIQGPRYRGVYVVVKQRWTIASHLPGVCTSVVVCQRLEDVAMDDRATPTSPSDGRVQAPS
jgi:hypothetical protein